MSVSACMTASRSKTQLWLLGLLLVLLGGIGFVLLRPPLPRPAAGSPEVQFTQQMIQHHQQAVSMARSIRERSQKRPIRSLALDIELSQQEQIRQMNNWLKVWKQPAGPPMTAEHAHQMGMASPAELQSLQTLPAAQAEQQFLHLMTRHHQGAVGMVQQVLKPGIYPEVQRLARQIAVTQQGEINTMIQMAARLGESGTGTSARDSTPMDMPEHQH